MEEIFWEYERKPVPIEQMGDMIFWRCPECAGDNFSSLADGHLIYVICRHCQKVVFSEFKYNQKQNNN